MIEYDITQQAANKLAGLCPFCASESDHLNLHTVGCPKLFIMSKMVDWGEWDGTWPCWGDEMVRNHMGMVQGAIESRTDKQY